MQPGPDFFVLGTEGGFLPSRCIVPSNQPFDPDSLSGSLITAPAERWDLLVDFKGSPGRSHPLQRCPCAVPGGRPAQRLLPGRPGQPHPSPPGFGPNTRQIMRFKVVPATSRTTPAITDNDRLTPDLDPFLVPPGTRSKTACCTCRRACRSGTDPERDLRWFRPPDPVARDKQASEWRLRARLHGPGDRDARWRAQPRSGRSPT